MNQSGKKNTIISHHNTNAIIIRDLNWTVFPPLMISACSVTVINSESQFCTQSGLNQPLFVRSQAAFRLFDTLALNLIQLIIPFLSSSSSRSSSLTCHKPRPDPHNHSSTLPCDSAHHAGPHTHSSTKHRPTPTPYGFASSWRTAAHPISLSRSWFTSRKTRKAEMKWGQQLVYTLQPHPLYSLYSTASVCFNGSDFRLERFIQSGTMQTHYRLVSALQSDQEPWAKKSSGFDPNW